MSRQRGVMVYPVIVPKEENTLDRYCFGINPNTYECFMIHNPEGVHWYVGYHKPFRFNDHNAKSSFYTLYEILELVDFTAPVDLADMIRTFGARLESNFYMAHSSLTSLEPRDSEADKHDPCVSKFIIDYFESNTKKKVLM